MNPVNLALGGPSTKRTVCDQFGNPWEGQVSVNINDDTIVDVTVAGNVLTLVPKGAGMTGVQAIGYDANGVPVPGAQVEFLAVVAPQVSGLTIQ